MKRAILLASILLSVMVACRPAFLVQYTYQESEDIGDGLSVGSLDDVVVDSGLIHKAIKDILRGKHKEVHSMLLLKDGKLVLEEYFTGHKYQWDARKHHGDLVTWDRNMLHAIMSDTKSITSICIGIAIDKGFIDSVDQSIFDYLPEHQHLNTDGKGEITIEHLLTMTSGLQWDEWSAALSSEKNDGVGIWFSEKDPLSFILERPLVSRPGTSFTYAGGNMIVLGEIIRQATGMDIDEFSGKYLFGPLGIYSFDWYNRFPNGVIEAATGLALTPRGMVKIGATFLDRGVWEGNQIVPEEWAEKSATTFAGNTGIDIPGEDSGLNGYSYSWWTKEYSESGQKVHMHSAGGWGGQHIMVLPELDAVVVFTGGNYTTHRPPFEILEDYLLPALIGS